MSAKDETNQFTPARKKIKLNEEVINLATKKSCRIKELTSRLFELSNEFQELKDLNEFDELVKILKIKQNTLENEESCPLYQLPLDVFNNCISYLDKSYGFVAPVSKRFQETYGQVFDGNKETATDFRGLSKEAGVYLIESFPEKSLTIDDNELYEFLYGKEFTRLESISQWNLCAKDYLTHKVVCQGNLDVFRHIVENGNILRAQDKDFFLYQKIAENGHLHILQYLKDEFYFFFGFCCSAYGAARGGHIHILKWLKELGCFRPENKRVVKKCAKIAAECGQLEVLEYMREHIDSLLDFSLIKEALQSKSLDILKFCRAQRDDYFQSVDEGKVIETGKVEIVRYFSDNQGKLSELSTFLAARHGHLDILKYLLSKGIHWDLDIFGNSGCHFEIMKLAYERRGEWFDTTIRDCIDKECSNFNLDMLNYLRQHECPWGSQVAYALIRLKKTAFLEYFREDFRSSEGVPGRRSILINAIGERWFEGIRYILENKLPCIVPALNLVAFDFPRLDVLKYCKSKGMQWNPRSTEIICGQLLRRVAQESTDVDTYKWIFNEIRAHQYHFEINLISSMHGYNHTDILEFLSEKDCVSDPENLLWAVSNGNLKSLKSLLMHYHDPLLIEESVFDEALNKFDKELENHDRKDIVSFLVKNKCPQALHVASD